MDSIQQNVLYNNSRNLTQQEMNVLLFTSISGILVGIFFMVYSFIVDYILNLFILSLIFFLIGVGIGAYVEIKTEQRESKQ